MTVHIVGHVAAGNQQPVDVEGFGALCNDCGVVVVCDTAAERDALHIGDMLCPACGGQQVCSCAGCIQR